MSSSQSTSGRELTPFARLLADHMAEYAKTHWPGRSIPEWAEQFGVSSQAVYDWFDKGAIPRASTLTLIAHATGLSRLALFQAAGVPLPEDQPWEDHRRRILRDARLPLEAREELAGCIEQVAKQYRADDAATDGHAEAPANARRG